MRRATRALGLAVMAAATHCARQASRDDSTPPAGAMPPAAMRPAAATPPPAIAAVPDPAAPVATCSVSGTIRCRSRLPIRMKQLTNTVDVPTCGATVVGEGLLVGKDGALANVFVEVRDSTGARLAGPSLPPASDPVVVRTQRCVTVPHVQVFPVGSSLDVENDDGISHELLTTSIRNEPLRALLPRYRRRVLLAGSNFTRPEKIKMTCAQHDWAATWLVVTDNPFAALTGPDGRFVVNGLPPGPCVVTAWHEELGTQGAELTLGAGANAVDLTFKASE